MTDPRQPEQRSTHVSRRAFLAAAGAGAAIAKLTEVHGMAAGPETVLPLSSLHSANWNALRAQFLLGDGLAYFNNGALGPSPRRVLVETARAWESMETNPADQYYGPLLREAEAVRAKAAAFLGCAVEEMAVTHSTTNGMNTVAQGLNLQPGERVLTTDHEHPGGEVCWEYFARRGVAIDRVKLPVPPRRAADVVELFRAALTPQTRVVSVSHVTFTTGLRLPVRRIAALAHANGSLVVVDGAQGPGALVVDVRALGCDAYATSAHKWMLAPKGTGLLYIRKEARAEIAPLVLHHGPRVYTAATGTRNLPAVIGLGAAIDFLEGIGKDRIEARALTLRQMAWERLAAVPGLEPVSPTTGELASPQASFALPSAVDNRAFAAALRKKHNVVVKVLPRTHFNGFRVSTHLYNSEADVERLAEAAAAELA